MASLCVCLPVAIVGPNGIGKSTFLNLLLMKLEPVSWLEGLGWLVLYVWIHYCCSLLLPAKGRGQKEPQIGKWWFHLWVPIFPTLFWQFLPLPFLHVATITFLPPTDPSVLECTTSMLQISWSCWRAQWNTSWWVHSLPFLTLAPPSQSLYCYLSISSVSLM